MIASIASLPWAIKGIGSRLKNMDKTQEELIEEGTALFGGFEGLLEKLPFQASTLRLIKAKQVKMSDKLRADLEKLIESRKAGLAPEVFPTAVLEETPEDVMKNGHKGETIEVDHPEAVAALFDETTRARLDKLAAASRLSPAQLVRVGTLRYMDQIEKTGEIIIRFNPKDGP
jgi:hypothetical protein